jgi:hypothetical protein
VVQAGAISWFYEGTGGNFDYWSEGLDGPMLSEQPPFSNAPLIADNDRMYHRIGAIGDPNAELPRMSASFQPDGDGKIGQFWRMEKSAPLIRAMRFACPFSGRRKFGTES